MLEKNYMIDVTYITMPQDQLSRYLVAPMCQAYQQMHYNTTSEIMALKTVYRAGSGTMYGVFGKPENMLDTDASASASNRDKPSAADKKKNLYTNPARKGTYGFPWQDRTIGSTKFEHVPDEYAR